MDKQLNHLQQRLRANAPGAKKEAKGRTESFFKNVVVYVLSIIPCRVCDSTCDFDLANIVLHFPLCSSSHSRILELIDAGRIFPFF